MPQLILSALHSLRAYVLFQAPSQNLTANIVACDIDCHHCACCPCCGGCGGHHCCHCRRGLVASKPPLGKAFCEPRACMTSKFRRFLLRAIQFWQFCFPIHKIVLDTVYVNVNSTLGIFMPIVIKDG